VAIRAYPLIHRPGSIGSVGRWREEIAGTSWVTRAGPTAALTAGFISFDVPVIRLAFGTMRDNEVSHRGGPVIPTIATNYPEYLCFSAAAAYDAGVASVMVSLGPTSTTTPTAGSSPSFRISPLILPGM